MNGSLISMEMPGTVNPRTVLIHEDRNGEAIIQCVVHLSRMLNIFPGHLTAIMPTTGQAHMTEDSIVFMNIRIRKKSMLFA